MYGWGPQVVILKNLKRNKTKYTAKYVMEHYCEIGRFSDKLYAGVTNEKGVEFIELPEFLILYNAC